MESSSQAEDRPRCSPIQSISLDSILPHVRIFLYIKHRFIGPGMIMMPKHDVLLALTYGGYL